MGLLTGGGGLGSGSTSSAGSTSVGGRPTRNPDQATGRPYSPTPVQSAVGGLAGQQQAANAGLNAQLQTLLQQIALSGSQYGLDQGALSIGHARDNAMLGQSNQYIGQQKGFANEGADLARQLLGYDRSQLGVDRADYSRDWAMRQWQLRNQQAARGSYVTAGHRFQDTDLNKQLLLADRGFDIQGQRIGTREDQVGLNLREQLAGLNNQGANNAIDQQYGSQSYENQQQQAALSNALTNLGYDAQKAEILTQMAQNNAQVAALVSQIIASASAYK